MRLPWSGSGADRYALNLGFSATRRVICCGALCTVRSTVPRPRLQCCSGPTISAGSSGPQLIRWLASMRWWPNYISVCRLQRSRWWVYCRADCGPGARQATAEINSALAARYGNGQVPYVTYRDISPTFFKNGVLDSLLLSNPQQVPSEPALHPSPERQERMTAALEPTPSELVGDVRHDR